MRNITLEELLQYYDDETDLIQIVLTGHDWDDAYELMVSSELLKPFVRYIVTDMRCEESYMNKTPVLRVGIEKGDNNDRLEKEAHFPEILGGCLQFRCYAGNCSGCNRTGCRSDHRADYGWGNSDSLYYRRRAC